MPASPPSAPSQAASSNWWGQLLFWSVISAAFIGPGTVTTAAVAGARFGSALLWALLFSTLACALLQYAAAMLPHRLGQPLGQALGLPFRGPWGAVVRFGVAATILLGGIAYQAGNLLGAMLGLRLLWPDLPQVSLLGFGVLAACLLWLGNSQKLAKMLGILVAAMGLMFLGLASQTPLTIGEVAGGFLPRLPADSLWVTLGLVGTTIVPYNLFLAAGLSQSSSPRGIKQGQTLAIIWGGLISMGILLSGTLLLGNSFSFEALGEVIATRMGPWARMLLGMGLMAAGLTSAITAPWAAGLTMRSILGPAQSKWQDKGVYFRWTWGTVLAAGLIFSLLDVKPVPVIILAQALNGLLLPGLAALLWWLFFHPRLNQHLPSSSPWLMGAFLIVVMLSTILGLLGGAKALAGILGVDWQQWSALLPILSGLGLLAGAVLLWRYRQIASQNSQRL